MRLQYLFAIILLFVISSCKVDPLADVEKEDWNHEKRILDIEFDGQIGSAEIETIDSDNGLISVQLASMLIEDMSRVEIKSLSVSYHATCSVSTGSTVDFTQAAPTISVTAKSGETRVYVVDMSDFEENLIGSYALTSSIIYGGTGPDYGGAAPIEPSEKSWCWDDNGYGPEAEYDDYLEFTMTEILDNGNTVGTCMHYGGVDKKHWNCIFSGDQNKDNPGAALDLHSYYRMVPIGESTWERNYTDGTLSFTDSTGIVTTGTLLNAGTYDLGYSNSVTVSGNAFRFDLSGVDDWDNIYSDYDKFVKRPRTYFILIQEVGEIPEASKTIGVEVVDLGDGDNDNDDGDDGDDNNDFEEGFEGCYALTSSIIYGGTGPEYGGAAAIEPSEKSWCWNQNGYGPEAEYDDYLEFTQTEVLANGNTKGTCIHYGGVDEKHWNCIFSGDSNKDNPGVALDLHSYYRMIPIGESTWEMDDTDGTLSFTDSGGNVTTGHFLSAGTYDLGYSNIVTVTGNAFRFDLNGVDDWDNEFEDYDKFVKNPRAYFILINKVSEIPESSKTWGSEG